MKVRMKAALVKGSWEHRQFSPVPAGGNVVPGLPALGPGQEGWWDCSRCLDLRFVVAWVHPRLLHILGSDKYESSSSAQKSMSWCSTFPTGSSFQFLSFPSFFFPVLKLNPGPHAC